MNSHVRILIEFKKKITLKQLDHHFPVLHKLWVARWYKDLKASKTHLQSLYIAYQKVKAKQ